MISLGTRLLLACLAMFLGQATRAASFNCSQARTSVERMICGDARLSALDDQLASAYTAATASGASAQIQAAQRNWLATRNHCRAASCVVEAYEQRLAELSGTSPASSAAATTSPVTAEGGKYCAFGPGDSYDMLLVRPDADRNLLFGLSSWTPTGSYFGVAGTARRAGAGWRYEADMNSPDPDQRCAVTIDQVAGGTYRIATVEGARCEAMAGHGAVLYGTDVFPPASRVGDAPASFTIETLMKVGCDRPARSGRSRR